VSWPYSPQQCPTCLFLQPLSPPAFDDAGYEIVGVCLHPRISTDLFLFKERAQNVGSCPCFRKRRQAKAMDA
jgi:hypothetical protein